jgi:hypothetical protein
VPFGTDTPRQINRLARNSHRNSEVTMSLLQKIDLYADRNEKADRRRPEYGFILALICVALALVIVNAMFGSAPSDVPLVGP